MDEKIHRGYLAIRLSICPEVEDGITFLHLDMMLYRKDFIIFNNIYDRMNNFGYPCISYSNFSCNIPQHFSYGGFAKENQQI